MTDEGIKVVEEFLAQWAASNEAAQDGEDIMMGSDDLEGDHELERLKACVGEFLPRIDGNPWLQSVLSTL